MTIRITSDQWWKNGLIYCLDVETFLDWDGDGMGDFGGLIERLDYLSGIGVTCLWLMPFYPTRERDDGYDVVDFYNVDHRLGSLGEFVEFIRTARDRGMKVIVDLVVNHTSDAHPWFQAARSDPDSRFRDWYVWADEPPEDGPQGVTFPGEQHSLWTYDDEAGQYYLYRFYAHQPDLNVANPAVREEIARIMGFWLELGVSGFRVDAVPFPIETEGIEGASATDPHDYLRDLRAFLSRRRGDAVLLGEVNLPPKEQRHFFGDEDGDELHLVFNFWLMQRLYLALARRDAHKLVEVLDELPEIPFDCQWATFVRNHDELTLDQLTDDERQEVFAAFGPEPRMQVYGRGLRRRLPTMLGGDERRLRMVYSLLFSLPGTPVLFYGEEIGMGENLEVEGRSAVRTPMQWSDEENGGFSTARPDRLPALPPGGEYGPPAVNVAAQRGDVDSLLNWFERMIRRRNETAEFGFGTARVLEHDVASVLAQLTTWDDSSVLAVHNLAPEPCRLALSVGIDDAIGYDDVLCGGRTPLDDPRIDLPVEGYGYGWYRIQREGRRITP